MTPVLGTFSVIPGRQHGRRIGIPTLNLDLGGQLLPLVAGIYAGVVSIESQRFPAVFHYGPRPMIDDPTVSFEAHLLNVRLPTTPRVVGVELEYWLRSIEIFPDETALKHQISLDIAAAQSVLGI